MPATSANVASVDRAVSSGVPGAIPFWKMSGSGNDFVAIDNRSGIMPRERAADFARAVCRRGVSIGADGVVLIERPSEQAPGADFRWRYINADGSDGEMCGNGAMCGARFAVLRGIAPRCCTFETSSGLVRATVADDASDPFVRIAIEDPGPILPARAIKIRGRSLSPIPIQVGVPHALLFVEDPDAFASPEDFAQIGRAVRLHPAFAPTGTNVNAIGLRADGTIRLRTYERGVEAETLACGTGAVASAIVATARGLTAPPVTVMTSSGLPLRVDFAWDGERARDVTLAGQARVVAAGEIWPEALE